MLSSLSTRWLRFSKLTTLAIITSLVAIALVGCSDSESSTSSESQSSSSQSSSSQSTSAATETTTKLVLSGTIFPVYDIVRQIAGDKADVSLLLAPGESPHTFNMTPSVQQAISESAIVFGIGEGLDEWIVDSDNYVVLTSGIELRGWSGEDDHDDDKKHDDDDDHDDHDHDDDKKHDDDDDHDDHDHDDDKKHDDDDDHDDHDHDDDKKHDDDDDHDDHDHHGHDHSGADPHYWLAPLNAIQMANNVAAELKRIDPENASYYEANLVTFTEGLETLQAELAELAEAVHDDAFITLHDAWYYFADAFDLNLVGSFEPTGAEEPSPRYLKKLADTVEEHDVHAIFSEPQLSTSSLKGFASDYGLEIAVLDPLGGVDSRDSYQALLRYNIETLVETLDHDH